MCNNCEHKPVCSIYRATGGVKSCEHHKEERKGEWQVLDECANAGAYCSVCHKKVYKVCYANCKMRSKFCPNCGADMRGTEDG